MEAMENNLEFETDVADEVIGEDVEILEPIPIGVVSDCEKLRVRKEPNTNSEIVCILTKNAKVMILGETPSNVEPAFYTVCTETGIEGFCMKQFIAVQ